jgi:hypothetical protein
MTPPSLVVIVLVPLIAWRVYKRVRRNIGRQRSALWRHWAGTILCPLLLAIMGLLAMRSLEAEGALLGGIACGIAAGIYGLRLTRFERDGAAFYYTPNAYLGMTISAVFIARLGWRFVELYGMGDAWRTAPPPDMTRSPLTLAVVGLTFAYYATYSLGLLRWRRRPA